MLVERTSIISGITRAIELEITNEQMLKWFQGTPVQIAMPHLSIDEREFIISGISKEEWEETFKNEEL